MVMALLHWLLSSSGLGVRILLIDLEKKQDG
jgi:hypothetical protein